MATTTRMRDRIFAAFGAILFLAGACAATVYYMVENPGGSDAATSQTTDTQKSKTQLQGTKLANFTPVAKVDSLQVTDTKVGSGQAVKAGDSVTVDYTGALAATGVIFQSSLDTGQPASFSLDGVIKGWQEGIPGMKVGGTRRLLIPAAEAYGNQAQSGIPANSDLVFDVTLHSIDAGGGN